MSRVAVFNVFNGRWGRRVGNTAMSSLDIKEIIFRMIILEDLQ